MHYSVYKTITFVAATVLDFKTGKAGVGRTLYERWGMEGFEEVEHPPWMGSVGPSQKNCKL